MVQEKRSKNPSSQGSTFGISGLGEAESIKSFDRWCIRLSAKLIWYRCAKNSVERTVDGKIIMQRDQAEPD